MTVYKQALHRGGGGGGGGGGGAKSSIRIGASMLQYVKPSVICDTILMQTAL